MAASENHRSSAVSRDGTRIAFVASGSGPPLLLVHGGAGDHTRWGVLRPYLEPHHTVYAMDRRGRGGSGDGPDYALEREYEDVAAVVEAIAGRSSNGVAVYGHSYGGLCAFGAAPLTSHLSRLVLYEGWPAVDPEALSADAALLNRLEELLGQGQRERVLEIVLREVVGMSEQEVAAYRAQPSWQARVAAAELFPREERAFLATPFRRDAAQRVRVPTLLLSGEKTQELWQADTVAGFLPDVRVTVLEGQSHTADIVAPERVAEQLLRFLGERAGSDSEVAEAGAANR
jgi:pimeloyl-ACP methyl ester carboxylesterase